MKVEIEVRKMGSGEHHGEPYTFFETLQDGEPTGETWETKGVVSAEEMAERLNRADALLAKCQSFYRGSVRYVTEGTVQ